MRAIRGDIAQVSRREARIGRVWRNVSPSTAQIVVLRGGLSEQGRVPCTADQTDRKGWR